MPNSAAKKSAVRRRDLERTKTRLLAAALAEFVARGFAGARTKAIARRAGVHEWMVFYCFGSKQNLYLEVMRGKLLERTQMMARMPDDLAVAMPAVFKLLARNRDVIRLFQWEALTARKGELLAAQERREALAPAAAAWRAAHGGGSRAALDCDGGADPVSPGFSPIRAIGHRPGCGRGWLSTAMGRISDALRAISGGRRHARRIERWRVGRFRGRCTRGGRGGNRMSSLRRASTIVLLLAAAGAFYYLGARYLWPPADTSEIETVGIIEAPEVNITSRIPGRIAMLNLQEGDEVEQGQVVCRIEDTDIRDELAQARANLASAAADAHAAELTSQRDQELFLRNVV